MFAFFNPCARAKSHRQEREKLCSATLKYPWMSQPLSLIYIIIKFKYYSLPNLLSSFFIYNISKNIPNVTCIKVNDILKKCIEFACFLSFTFKLSEDNSPKITVVGVSKDVKDITGTLAGTPLYIAPEVFHSKLLVVFSVTPFQIDQNKKNRSID